MQETDPQLGQMQPRAIALRPMSPHNLATRLSRGNPINDSIIAVNNLTVFQPNLRHDSAKLGWRFSFETALTNRDVHLSGALGLSAAIYAFASKARSHRQGRPN